MPGLVDDTDDEDDEDAGTIPAQHAARGRTAAADSSSTSSRRSPLTTSYSTCVDGEKGAAPRDTVPKHFSDIAKISDVKERNMWYKTHYHELDRTGCSRTRTSSRPCPFRPG